MSSVPSQHTQTQVALLVAAALQIAARTPLVPAPSSSLPADGNDGNGSAYSLVRAGLTTPASAAAAVAAASDRRKRAELAAAAAAARKLKAAVAAAAAAAKASSSSSSSSSATSSAEAPLSEVCVCFAYFLCPHCFLAFLWLIIRPWTHTHTCGRRNARHIFQSSQNVYFCGFFGFRGASPAKSRVHLHCHQATRAQPHHYGRIGATPAGISRSNRGEQILWASAVRSGNGAVGYTFENFREGWRSELATVYGSATDCLWTCCGARWDAPPCRAGGYVAPPPIADVAAAVAEAASSAAAAGM